MTPNLGDRMDGGGVANVWLPGRASGWNGAIELLGDGETRLYVDRRCGFAVAVPGRPELLATDLVPRPVRHAALRLGDAPIEVGFRLDELPTTMAPATLVPALVATYARAEGAGARVSIAPPEQAERWGAEAAASAIYAPAARDASGADVVEVTMLARRHEKLVQVMIVTKRFPQRAVSPFVWASFNSAMMAQLAWREPLPEAAASPWPESDWARPGIALELLPAKASIGATLRALAARDHNTLRPLTGRLSLAPVTQRACHLRSLETADAASLVPGLASALPRVALPGAPPSQPLDDRARGEVLERLRRLVRTDEQELFLAETVARLTTVHDLRAVALAFWEALTP
jgi:hypothetical protein